MANSLSSVNRRPGHTSTPQSQRARPEQVKNSAGGYTFQISDLERVKRFLILGSERNFYSSGAALSAQNADTVIKLAQNESQTLVDLIVEISTEGRAAKQQPGLFALAIAASYGSDDDKRYALSKLPAVARTASSLFTFLGFVQQFRGWGRALSKAVAAWYHDKDTDRLSYQMVKYRSRDGFSHADVYKLAHIAARRMDPNAVEKAPDRQALGEWALRGTVTEQAPALVQAFESAKSTSGKDTIKLIRSAGLSWEMLPSEEMGNADVWSELILNGNVPLGALLRQLSRLTNLGLLAPGNKVFKQVVARLTDQGEIGRARLHPVNILIAAKTYALGHGLQGKGSWTPVPRIIDALDEAFELSFATVEPTGKRYLIGLDVSGSMGVGVMGSSLTAREATAAIALTLVRAEEQVDVIGFTSTGWNAGDNSGARGGWYRRTGGVTPLDISPRRRLDDVVNMVQRLQFGATDCALPMLYAKERGLEVDTFITMTDNETWSGNVHPHEALEQYRKSSGINSRSIVLATQATNFTIADPSDAGMLDVAGFDSAVPSIIAEFSKGL